MPIARRRLAALPLLLLAGLLAACAASAGPPPTAAPRTPTPAQSGPAPPIRGAYAALGASETYGVGAVPQTDGYAYLVARALGTKHFVDVGIPGATLDAGYDTELASALAARPSLCTVFFGINDIRAGVTRDAFLRDLHDLVVTLRRAHAEVLIIGIPDLSHLPAVSRLRVGGLQALTNSWNSGMQRVAQQTGAHFLDLRQYDAELASHPNYIAPDGLHPSDAGHARLAQVVVAAIRHDRLWKRP